MFDKFISLTRLLCQVIFVSIMNVSEKLISNHVDRSNGVNVYDLGGNHYVDDNDLKLV